MCGLVALIQLDGRLASRSEIERMSATIRHRGPDDEGVYLSGPIGLAHRRLSIIDLATGHQPMSVDGITVVFNGEIYNYIELKEDLRQRGHEFRTASDTEVLLRMYLEHGEQCVSRLNGMFAFVLYDDLRKAVVSARDHFGIKPLYVHRTATQVMFASEIKALLAHSAVRAEVDEVGLDDYVTLQYALGERTLFRGIRKHLPAHVEVLDLASGKTTVRRYWQPAFQVDATLSESQCTEELEAFAGEVRAPANAKRCAGGRLPERRPGLQHRRSPRGARNEAATPRPSRAPFAKAPSSTKADMRVSWPKRAAQGIRSRIRPRRNLSISFPGSFTTWMNPPPGQASFRSSSCRD